MGNGLHFRRILTCETEVESPSSLGRLQRQSEGIWMEGWEVVELLLWWWCRRAGRMVEILGERRREGGL